MIKMIRGIGIPSNQRRIGIQILPYLKVTP